jgi:hypothetical protein
MPVILARPDPSGLAGLASNGGWEPRSRRLATPNSSSLMELLG